MSKMESEFFKKNPNNLIGVTRLRREQLNGKDVASDPLLYLSNRMWEYSRESIRAVSCDVEKDSGGEPTAEMSGLVLARSQADVACLFFSSIQPELRYAADSGIFSQENTMSRMQEGLRGTLIRPFGRVEESEGITGLNENEWQALKNAQKRDVTLTNIFEHATALPKVALKLIAINTNVDFFPLMNLLYQVAIEWRPLAQAYMDASGVQWKFQPERTLRQSVQELLPGANLLPPVWKPPTEDDLKSLGFSKSQLERLVDMKKRFVDGTS